ncbi:tripartite tricarboxylate transporter TctB family protein [Epibacterium ulvae]|uniref:tripartite tricarboxylate transporter TctB family protein n=1 Tax=Epibacterium ulvae TaxID=1156985 RepID=UPI001BFCBF94|nr:tripartite tricarboxylate transporter TctB family protein [Epibacterium ulvae]MBT8154808.1 tripartite tricarboxylate transporter TctB family protein [Epibacterium ulvae]
MQIELEDGQRATLGQQVERIAGASVLVALSLYFMIGGFELGLGSPFRPGTGAFPFFSGLVLLALAAAILWQDLHSTGITERPDWVSFGAIVSALMVFALVTERFGLLPATFLTVLTASAPDRSLPWWGKILLGLFMAALGYVLFIEALGLPFKAFRAF